jgi:hypothetical protein
VVGARAAGRSGIFLFLFLLIFLCSEKTLPEEED